MAELPEVIGSSEPVVACGLDGCLVEGVGCGEEAVGVEASDGVLIGDGLAVEHEGVGGSAECGPDAGAPSGFVLGVAVSPEDGGDACESGFEEGEGEGGVVRVPGHDEDIGVAVVGVAELGGVPEHVSVAEAEGFECAWDGAEAVGVEVGEVGIVGVGDGEVDSGP